MASSLTMPAPTTDPPSRTDPLATDPLLPPEIEKRIFEVAALSSPKSVPALLLVARRVKIWIEPVLFHVLSLYGPGRTGKTPNCQLFQYPILSQLFESRPPSFFHDHVRHVQFTAAQTPDIICKVLSLCDATNSLSATCLAGSPTLSLLSILGALPLKRLSTVFALLFSGQPIIDFSHALFSDLSHLSLWTGATATLRDGLGSRRCPCSPTSPSETTSPPTPSANLPWSSASCSKCWWLCAQASPTSMPRSSDGRNSPRIRDLWCSWSRMRTGTLIGRRVRGAERIIGFGRRHSLKNGDRGRLQSILCALPFTSCLAGLED
ncbi:hypothetical protein B0H11DRAFT_1340732 [Mycena galericulata]|nr:hypothetical protein B0H11DRAFT_1340732 [Mycena galericulata]